MSIDSFPLMIFCHNSSVNTAYDSSQLSLKSIAYFVPHVC